ncbi:MAG TPA: type II toxin-antitoxin system RelE/ParE family toxin [Desulfuromonadales bacterium]|nr:type II toxin-antitoxin system RelE/ParE family toxin [Desulfuromonadales bacterium]
MKLEWLPQAQNDFDEIIDYIAEDNPFAAIEQGDEIESQVAGLLDNRHQGRPGRVKGTREPVIVRTPYIAAYRIKKESIHILRLLHSARLWPERF